VDIVAGLRSRGLQQYAAAFRDKAVGAAILLDLPADDLKDLDVSIVGSSQYGAGFARLFLSLSEARLSRPYLRPELWRVRIRIGKLSWFASRERKDCFGSRRRRDAVLRSATKTDPRRRKPGLSAYRFGLLQRSRLVLGRHRGPGPNPGGPLCQRTAFDAEIVADRATFEKTTTPAAGIKHCQLGSTPNRSATLARKAAR
jgi:hypothetical protein